MKVLVLASTFPRWKNDTTPPFVYELEKRLAKDFEIYVLAPHYEGAKKYEERDGLKIYRFQYFWPVKWQKLCYEGGILPNIKKNKLLILQGLTLILFELINVLKLIRRERIELIHAHWIIPHGFIALLTNKIIKTPYMVTAHGSDVYGLQNSVLLLLKKLTLKNAKKVSVVSNAVKKEVIRNSGSEIKIEIIPMGVNSKQFSPTNRNLNLFNQLNIQGPFLLFVGRLAESKGTEYLIRAMKLIIKRKPNAKLIIVGGGPLEEKLKGLVKSLNLENSVSFAGKIPHSNLPQYYASADIFICPSIKTEDGQEEGLGLTFVEAAFSGCIPIGTHVGGISDVIDSGHNGFLVEERNPESISESVLYLLNRKSEFNRIKAKTRPSLINKFDWVPISKKYIQFYKI